MDVQEFTPRIDYNVLGEAYDRRRLTEIVKLARRLAKTEPLAGLIEQELSPGPHVATNAQLEAAIDAGLMTFYHATATVPMGGERDPAAVVDEFDRVRHTEGSRVVDASIFSQAVSCPINLTILMVAERLAQSSNN